MSISQCCPAGLLSSAFAFVKYPNEQYLLVGITNVIIYFLNFMFIPVSS